MDDIKVSVLCTAYNHERYISRCIEGFVNQKTNFKYEVIIHDDCSTDNTLQIIKKYAEKFPNIINVISEEENKYSKNIDIINDILFPKSAGKYIALCEGDDYWCDENKLQKQFDFMESNPNVSLSTHNTVIHDLSGKKRDKTFNTWCDIHILSDEEIFLSWDVHTSSFFFKRSVVEDYIRHYMPIWCGDYARLIYARSVGDVVALPDIMSVYNANNVNGSMWRSLNKDIHIKRENDRIKLLEEYDKNTKWRFHEICLKRENKILYDVSLTQLGKLIDEKASSQERIDMYNFIKQNMKCKEYLDTLSNSRRILEKIKLFVKAYFPALLKLRNIIKRK